MDVALTMTDDTLIVQPGSQHSCSRGSGGSTRALGLEVGGLFLGRGGIRYTRPDGPMNPKNCKLPCFPVYFFHREGDPTSFVDDGADSAEEIGLMGSKCGAEETPQDPVTEPALDPAHPVQQVNAPRPTAPHSAPDIERRAPSSRQQHSAPNGQ